MKLDYAAAERALGEVAARIDMTGPDAAARAAEAALRVTTAVMSTELYKNLAQRGEDPRDFDLMAFGGAGPTHANLLADEARIRTVIIPPASATFCAMGAILADVKRDYVRSVHLKFADGRPALDRLAGIFHEIEQEANAWIRAEGELLGDPTFVATCDMRYAGQAFDLPVRVPEPLRRAPDIATLTELFHIEHEKIYGFRDPDSSAEITTERIQVVGKIPPINLPDVAHNGEAAPKPAGSQLIFHEGAYVETPVYYRRDLAHGCHIAGPAIIEQEDCTIWVLATSTSTVDRIGNLIISTRHASA
jgi:N-methylhydantoinase A